MNIFTLDQSPIKSAELMLDKHVVKMPTESLQMLFTIVDYLGLEAGWKPVMLNHPSTIWARETRQNFQWLREHTYALCREYTHRYGKRHKSIDVINWCIINKPNIPDIGFTTPAMAMPDEFKVDSVVESYRNYYMGAKISLASWKNREKPFWFGKKELDLQYD